MATQLAALSNEIAAAVAQAAHNVVAVHARPRFSSSGVFWRPGVIVTAEHTIRREEEITVTLPDGTNASATLAGTDPGTDIAVLKIDAATQAPGITTTAPAPGTLALAIGRSQDSGPNATLGIISAVERRVADVARRAPRTLPAPRSHPLPRVRRWRRHQRRKARPSESPPARFRASRDSPSRP